LNTRRLRSESFRPAESTGANLIAMGSHGRTGIAKLWLGSVAMKVLQLSPVPVMVIK
jgi:nucleotide-binding universal stress UspA family protein